MDNYIEKKIEMKKFNSCYKGLATKVMLYAAAGIASVTGVTAMPGCGGGGGGGGSLPPPVYLTEAEGDNALENQIDTYYANSEILDYDMEWVFDLNGFLVDVDARVILNDGTRIAVWYQGENDGDHLSEKAELNAYGIDWVQIGPCEAGELEGILDGISAGGWIQGEYP